MADYTFRPAEALAALASLVRATDDSESAEIVLEIHKDEIVLRSPNPLFEGTSARFPVSGPRATGAWTILASDLRDQIALRIDDAPYEREAVITISAVANEISVHDENGLRRLEAARLQKTATTAPAPQESGVPVVAMSDDWLRLARFATENGRVRIMADGAAFAFRPDGASMVARLRDPKTEKPDESPDWESRLLAELSGREALEVAHALDAEWSLRKIRIRKEHKTTHKHLSSSERDRRVKDAAPVVLITKSGRIQAGLLSLKPRVPPFRLSRSTVQVEEAMLRKAAYEPAPGCVTLSADQLDAALEWCMQSEILAAAAPGAPDASNVLLEPTPEGARLLFVRSWEGDRIEDTIHSVNAPRAKTRKSASGPQGELDLPLRGSTSCDALYAVSETSRLGSGDSLFLSASEDGGLLFQFGASRKTPHVAVRLPRAPSSTISANMQHMAGLNHYRETEWKKLLVSQEDQIASLIAEETSRGTSQPIEAQGPHRGALLHNGSDLAQFGTFIRGFLDSPSVPWSLDPDLARELILKAQAGDEAAREHVELGMTRFALSLAGRPKHKLIPVDERFSIARVAISRAILSWRSDEASLPHLAAIIFDNLCTDELGLLQSGAAVTSGKGGILEVAKAYNALKARHGEVPTVREIATAMGRIDPKQSPMEQETEIRRIEPYFNAIQSAYAAEISQELGGHRSHGLGKPRTRRLADILAAEPAFMERDPEAGAERFAPLERALLSIPALSADPIRAFYGLGGRFRLSHIEYGALAGQTADTTVTYINTGQKKIADTISGAAVEEGGRVEIRQSLAAQQAAGRETPGRTPGISSPLAPPRILTDAMNLDIWGGETPIPDEYRVFGRAEDWAEMKKQQTKKGRKAE